MKTPTVQLLPGSTLLAVVSYEVVIRYGTMHPLEVGATTFLYGPFHYWVWAIPTNASELHVAIDVFRARQPSRTLLRIVVSC